MSAGSWATGGLLERVSLPREPGAAGLDESAWIEVVHKMDEIYAELVRYQVELEQKSEEFARTQRFVQSVL